MVFSRSAYMNWNVEYAMAGHKLERVESIMYLGVEFDKKLTFNKHAQQVSAKSVRITNAAARLSKYIGDKSINLRLFNIYNDPIIQYGAAV